MNALFILAIAGGVFLAAVFTVGVGRIVQLLIKGKSFAEAIGEVLF